MLAETMVLRRLCEERIPESPDRFQALCILWQVFDAYIQELFRVTTEFLILRVEQRNVQLERFYSFSEVILNTMEDGVIVTDLHGRITKINRAARELLGFKEEEMIGAAAPYPFWKHGEQASARNLVEECLRTGKAVHELDVGFSTRNGDTLSLPVHAVPVHNQTGDMSGALLVFRDLREMKRLAAELRRATLSRGSLAA
jgi:PAS domain S-box-containing protein